MTEAAPKSPRTPRRSRRVSRPAAPGTDERPGDHPLDALAEEDAPGAWGEGQAAERSREAELRRDKPPHWS
ncbi:hypothetical protein [Leucobacter sp. M11]|uniref:hypothetical protein n=1 Tax=Leucobacter sp. M11 TaxID=2993565 RepID=UPI002D7E54C4|nr:hypothetical protein [Leucobacter sp. M11]MEB4614108.1 hypothetical protein [Leucobacter sp. M11]